MKNEILDKLDLTHLDKYLVENLRYDFYNRSGIEHYRLLNYLCNGLDLVYDIGTYRGLSSIAMSSAKQVKSFDIEDLKLTKDKENITYSLGEYLTKDIFKADLILIDIDHSGVREREILNYLKGYKGVIILDDIHHFKQLNVLWNELDGIDLTEYGHWSGTGMIRFNNR